MTRLRRCPYSQFLPVSASATYGLELDGLFKVTFVDGALAFAASQAVPPAAQRSGLLLRTGTSSWTIAASG